jgi:hypothetical protein
MNEHIDDLFRIYKFDQHSPTVLGCRFGNDVNESWKNVVSPGNVRLLKWKYNKDLTAIIDGSTFECSWPNDIASIAVKVGSLQCLVFIYLHSGIIDTHTFEEASKFGSIKCVEYLHYIGCPMSAKCLTNAVESRHIEVVKYLVSIYCPMNSNACAAADLTGNLECLIFLRAKGCPWNFETAKYAYKSIVVLIIDFFDVYNFQQFSVAIRLVLKYIFHLIAFITHKAYF